MIDVYIKMKTDKYDQIIEEYLVNFGNLTKDTKEHYYTDGDGMGTVYGRCRDLMKKDWFRDNVEKLSWIVDDEGESDLIEHFTRTLSRDGYIL